MCGRIKLEGDFVQIKATFGIPNDYPAANYAPSWNVAPTDSVPIVRYNAKGGRRTPRPHALGPGAVLGQGHQVSFANINAMAETVDPKPAFKAAFTQRRCLYVGLGVLRLTGRRLGPPKSVCPEFNQSVTTRQT